MILIANSDFKKLMRLLDAYIKIPAKSNRESESRRQAYLLLRKWRQNKQIEIKWDDLRKILRESGSEG